MYGATSPCCKHRRDQAYTDTRWASTTPRSADSVKDIGALFDWIATQLASAAGRVAVVGQSYGGYMVAWPVYNDRIAGAIDLYGISDWVTFLQNTEGYRDARRAEYGDERDPKMRGRCSTRSRRSA